MTVGASVGIVEATGGPALDFSSMTADFQLTTLKSTNSSTTGVSLAAIAGTVSAGSGSVITNPSGIAFNVSNSGPTVAYAGSITANNGRAVSISNSAAGSCGSETFSGSISGSGASASGILVNNCNTGTMTFSGSAQTLTTQGNNGVTLTNNGGAIIDFTGGNLDVVTTTGKPFTATGGGTVSVTGAGNTLTTESDGSPAGGTILEVTDTTSAGITFASVTGHGGSSTAKGVYIKSAGSGGVTINGGTITNYVQKGIHVDSSNNITLSGVTLTGNGTTNLGTAATCGDDKNGTNTNCAAGIDLQIVTTASLTNVTVSGGAQIGINGKTVSGLTFNAVQVSGAGNEALEDGVQLAELTGTNNFTSVNFHDNASRQLAVQNSTGTGTLNITSSSFTNVSYPTLATTPSSTTAAQGIVYSGHGNANMTLNVQSSTFTKNFGAAVFSDTESTAVMSFTVNDGTISGNGLAIQVAGVGSGTFNYTLSGVAITVDSNAVTGPVSFFRGGDATGNWTGSVTGNTLGTTGVSFSGSPCTSCVGMIFENAGTLGGSHNVTISGNTILQTGHTAIHVATSTNGNNDVGAMNVKILNNTIGEPSQAGDSAIMVLAGDSVAGDTSSVCADVSGNTITNGVNAWNAAAFIAMNERFTNTLRLPGFGGGTGATAAAFVKAQNGNVNTVVADGDDNFIGGGAACF